MGPDLNALDNPDWDRIALIQARMKELHADISKQMAELLEVDAKEVRKSMGIDSMSHIMNDTATELESGQVIHHHPKDRCQAPCALHAPMEGPWSEWPRQYIDTANMIYRVCPHNIAHPAIEQVLFAIKTGKPGLIAHECCHACPPGTCMPRTGIPDEFFDGDLVHVFCRLINWADREEDVKSNEPKPEPEKTKLQKPEGQIDYDDPNWQAQNYLHRYRLVMPSEFYGLLSVNMLSAHHITVVEEINGTRCNAECSDDCNNNIIKRDGRWKVVSSWCPTIQIALHAGWEPVEWQEDGA